MKFGKVEHPENVDFTLPIDHPSNKRILKTAKQKDKKTEIYVGCAKWNRQDLKGFYPRGTKDELTYYSQQFNSIELNATFYRIFPREQVEKWKNKTPEGFKFFPKISQSISQFKRLKNVAYEVDSYVNAIEGFEEKLGMVFLQLHPTFKPKDIEVVKAFLSKWPIHIPLSIEFRHTDWYNDLEVANDIFSFLEEKNVTSIITDTAGRRDLVHMRLSTPNVFVRWTGANHESDYKRLDDWLKRIEKWIEQGIDNIYFFVHQNIELESPLLSSYFIEKLNDQFGYNLKIPTIGATKSLFD